MNRRNHSARFGRGTESWAAIRRQFLQDARGSAQFGRRADTGGWSGNQPIIRRAAVRRGRGSGPTQGGPIQRFRALRPVQRGLTIVILLGLLAIPLLAIASALQDYAQLKNLGTDAVHHLLAAKEAIAPSQSTSSGSGCATTSPSATTPSQTATAAPGRSGASGSSGALGSIGLPDAAHLATAQREFLLAQREFLQLGDLLDRPGPTLALGGHVPGIQNKVSAVRQLVFVGNDVSTLGYNLLTAAIPLLTRLHNGALAADTQPLMTATEATQLRSALVSSLGMFDDLEARVSNLNPDDLPVSACQRAEYVHLASLLPDVRGLLANAPEYFDVARWVMGVDQPRQFFLQTMDPDELRPTGGFTGDFTVVQTGGGRVKPFDIRSIDCCYLNTPWGLRPPTVYDWWTQGRWGLRDSNLSPDFPTTAKMNIDLFQGPQHMWSTLGLSNHNLDGVIQVSAIAIAHVLVVTGPIAVPAFGETLTPTNFWDTILAYQNDNGRIDKQAASPACAHVPVEIRKCFTYTVGHLLEDRVRHLSLSQLLTLAKNMVKDVQAHDIQIYVTDPQVESFLLQQGLAQRLNTAPGVDSLTINQTNLSVNKISRSIDVVAQDDVALDTQGGALHHLVITLANNPEIDPQLYRYSYFTTYLDYVRVYVPAQAQLQYANGFDTGNPVCWVAPPSDPKAPQPARFKALPACDTIHGFFQDKSLSCPAGDWGPGLETNNIFGVDSKTYQPVEDTGYPTNLTSDVPGRAMYGGWVKIPLHCTAMITLTYYVAHVALPATTVAANAPAYTYVIERQAGTYIKVRVNIQPANGVADEVTTPVHFKTTLDADATVSIPRVSSQQSRTGS